VACQEFDGQVVRLEQVRDLADKFVRVRLTRIEHNDLNLFEFDYDLTFIVFFLNADGKVYARYGGRDAEGPDSRQSLAGLRYTMQSVLDAHGRDAKVFARRSHEKPRYVGDLPGIGHSSGCVHCHHVREALNKEVEKQGNWTRDLAWRYPPPENLGFDLEIDRGNVVKEVKKDSPASRAGLKPGDAVVQLNAQPVHSFADAQFALDIAPVSGSIELVWQRGDKTLREQLSLPPGWRKTDITWRASMQHLVPTARLYGADLTAKEKQALDLSPKQLAFRQTDSVPAQAKAAGIRPGDIILGVDDKEFDSDDIAFRHYIERNYLIGDQVTVNVLRSGTRLRLAMTLIR
jgi:membrane-associated protease RseP (regulator of RpoE activity)